MMDLDATFDRIRALRRDTRDPEELTTELARIRREINQAAADRDPDPAEPATWSLYQVVRYAADLEEGRITGQPVPDGIAAAMVVADFEEHRDGDQRRQERQEARTAARSDVAAHMGGDS